MGEVTHYNVFRATLILIKHVMWPLCLWVGFDLLTSITSSAFGFKFFGIIALSTSAMLLILFCVDCCTADDAEEVFLSESICCGVPLYLLIVSLGIFALTVSSHGTGKSIPGTAYKEYELGSYSRWMQNKVNDTYRWERYYKSTLIKHRVCSDMVTKYKLDTLDQLHKRPLNCFESGCCKPPEECNLNYTNPTVWEKQQTRNYSNVDCNTWSNDPTKLCFDCQSCKAAFVQDVKHHWFDVGLAIVIVFSNFVLAVIIYALCYCFNPNMC